MSEPAPAVLWTYEVPSALRGTSQRDGGARSDGPKPLLDQRPARFDRVEVVRVRGKKSQRGAGSFDEVPHRAGLMGAEIVKEDNVAAPEPRDQPAADPHREPVGVHGVPVGRHRDPAVDAHRAHHRADWCPSSWAAARSVPCPAAATHASGPSRGSRPIRPRTPNGGRLPCWPRPGRPRVRLGRSSDRVRPAASVFLKTYPSRCRAAGCSSDAHAPARRRAGCMRVSTRRSCDRAARRPGCGATSYRPASATPRPWPAGRLCPSRAAAAPTVAASLRRRRTSPPWCGTTRPRLRTPAPHTPAARRDRDWPCVH